MMILGTLKLYDKIDKLIDIYYIYTFILKVTIQYVVGSIMINGLENSSAINRNLKINYFLS